MGKMKQDPLDPIHDAMIAALYGELSAEEMSKLRAVLERDAELRRQWLELGEARSFLSEASDEEPAPSFVFTEPAAPESGRRGRAGAELTAAGAGLARRIRALWRSPLPGFALATAALIVLLLAGLRVDRTGGGLLVHFGNGLEPGPQLVATETGLRAEQIMPAQSAEPLEPGRQSGPPAHEAFAGDQGRAVPVADLGGYLTRAEFVAYAEQMNGMFQGLVMSEENRRRAELAYVVRGLYTDIERNQEQRYSALDTRIQQVWLGLAGLGAREAGRLETVPAGDGTESPRLIERSSDNDR